MKVFCIENQEIDRYALLSIVVSMQINAQEYTVVLYCSDSTYNFIKGFYDFTINIEHVVPEYSLAPYNFINNLISAINYIHSGGEDAFFISNDCFIMNDLKYMLSDDFTSEVVTIKRNVGHDKTSVKYPLITVLFKIGDKATTWLENYYKLNKDTIKTAEEKYNELCEIDTTNMNDVDLKRLGIQKSIALSPLSDIVKELIPNMVSEENSIVTEFFNGDVFIDICNFFAKDDSWKMQDFTVDDDIKIARNGTKCCISGTSPDNLSLDSQHRAPIMQLWKSISQIVYFNDIRLTICQSLTNKAGANRIILGLPKKDLIGNWGRNDMPMFTKALLNTIIQIPYLNALPEATNDYYIAPYSVIYDYKDESLVKPELINRIGFVILLNYNTKLLSILEGNYVYCGLYNPMINILETQEPVKERTQDMFNFTDDKIEFYSTNEKYMEYINELKNFKTSFITDKTCKSHIVDCLALGVVPVIDNNCTILEIEDLLEDASFENKSKKCVDYFKNNLTAKAIGKRIISSLMQYKQETPKAMTR